ncbi:hypothetical protein [Roseateles sp. P5_E11]
MKRLLELSGICQSQQKAWAGVWPSCDRHALAHNGKALLSPVDAAGIAHSAVALDGRVQAARGAHAGPSAAGGCGANPGLQHLLKPPSLLMSALLTDDKIKFSSGRAQPAEQAGPARAAMGWVHADGLALLLSGSVPALS